MPHDVTGRSYKLTAAFNNVQSANNDTFVFCHFPGQGFLDDVIILLLFFPKHFLCGQLLTTLFLTTVS